MISAKLFLKLFPVGFLLAMSATTACSGALEPTFTPPTPSPRISEAEAIAFIKAYWERNKEPHIQRIRQGNDPPDEIVLGYYEECKRINPKDLWSESCGTFSGGIEGLRDGMVASAYQLQREGTWDAYWEASTRSWLVTGRHKAFAWNFRLFETTLTVEIVH